jgi:hypothetical protein
MFHRPAAIGGGINIHQSGPESNNIVLNENENVMMHRNNAKTPGAGIKPSSSMENPTKTPASNTAANRRRAFGDISNKKKNGSSSSVGGFAQAKQQLQKKDTSNVLKPSSKSTNVAFTALPTPSQRAAKTPGAKAPVSMIPRMTTTSHRGPLKATTTAATTAKRTVTSKPQQRIVTFLEQPHLSQASSSLTPLMAVKPSNIKAPQSSSRKPLAPLPNNVNIVKSVQSESSKLKSTKTTARRRTKFRIEEPVPDIELPAGRTWKEQLEYDLKDEDDAASTSTLDQLWKENGVDCFDERAMWDDWRESMRQEMELKNQQADQFLQDQIDAMLEKDRQDCEKGLESLCDIVDGLEILCEQDLNLSISQDDDDWSFPASSLCGPGAEDSFFQL